MNDVDAIAANIRRAQVTMFEEAAKRGITQKIIYYDSDRTISVSAIGQYARGESIMGLAVMNRLSKILPPDLLSLLLVDDELQIVKAPAELDHDDLAEAMVEYLADKQRAHHPESECGPAIGPGEHSILTAKVVHLPVVRMAG